MAVGDVGTVNSMIRSSRMIAILAPSILKSQTQHFDYVRLKSTPCLQIYTIGLQRPLLLLVRLDVSPRRDLNLVLKQGEGSLDAFDAIKLAEFSIVFSSYRKDSSSPMPMPSSPLPPAPRARHRMISFSELSSLHMTKRITFTTFCDTARNVVHRQFSVDPLCMV